jgi:predicted dehydrogenase
LGSGFTVIDYGKLDIPRLGVGVLGYGFMGKVHSNAYLKIPYTCAEPPAYPQLIAMAGRNRERVEDTAKRFGYRGYYTDWREMVRDPDIQLFDNCTPDDMHREPSVAAAEAGKHVICEKPLAMTVQDAKDMWDAVREAGVKHMLCHNYRFMPAVRLAKKLIDEEEIGTIYQFRGVYLQEVGHGPSEVLENVWYAAGTRSGVLLGIGCHIIDIARFLMGEMRAVTGMVRTFNRSRKNSSGKTETVMADEVNGALVEFESGAVGTIESAGVSTGRKNQLSWEINGSKGSLTFDLEDLNHLHVCLDKTSVKDVRGFTNISVTDFSHPLQSQILPPGHNSGWEFGHVHALNHFIDCIVNHREVAPYGATFEDGYRIQVIMDAIVSSSKEGKKKEIQF